MKKIAIIVLALVVLSFGWECAVGELRYCHEDYRDNERKQVTYGGPESKIREMMNDPCDGEKIILFAFTYFQREGDRFVLYCGNFKYHITPDSLELFIGYDRAAIDYGHKAKMAWKNASKAAKFITENTGKIGWNP